MQKRFCLKILFYMFLANFIFVVSHLKIRYPGNCQLGLGLVLGLGDNFPRGKFS